MARRLSPQGVKAHPMLNRKSRAKSSSRYTGRECALSMRDFLLLSEVREADAWMLSDKCQLAEDWQFRSISIGAWTMLEPGANALTSIYAIVIRGVHCLEWIFRLRFPHASCPMVADFWNSHQVDEFLEELCGSLRTSEKVLRFSQDDLREAEDQLEHARHFTRRWISLFVREVLAHSINGPLTL